MVYCILDRLKSGQENLRVICGAIDFHHPIDDVLASAFSSTSTADAFRISFAGNLEPLPAWFGYFKQAMNCSTVKPAASICAFSKPYL